MTQTEINEILWTAHTNAQGSQVLAGPQELAAMQDLGLVGANRGLTRKGSIARERLVNKAMEF